MSDIDEILQELEKKPTKKPKNVAWIGIVFADLVFALLDAGSGLGVAYLTSVWYYGVVVFFAGIIPLVMWQKLYTNAYAADAQKTASLWGGGLAVVSVVMVAVGVGILRFTTNAAWVEGGLVAMLVVTIAIHGLIAAYYYYSDEEISETQKSTQMVGRAARKIIRYKTAEKVLYANRKAVGERKRVSGAYSSEAVDKVLDEDNTPN